MNNISFPVQLATLLRRLVNIVSTISLTNQYLLARTQAGNYLSEGHVPSRPEPYSYLLDDFRSTRSGGRWDWLTPGYKFSWFTLRLATNLGQDPFPSPSSVTQKPKVDPGKQDVIHRLMNNPTLFDPIRTPRYPIVLCHGLYGFDVRGPSVFPSLRYHYWSNVLAILKKKIGADVIVTAVPGTGSIASRAETLNHILQQRARGRGVNLMAHSMGGLDCRHLITHIQPTEYAPLSLTSISTPHRGSPFMDWCAQYLGLGRSSDAKLSTTDAGSTSSDYDKSEKREYFLSFSSLPSSFTTLILSYLDSPAYANLTTSYLNDVFNPSTPDDPHVKYFSVVSRIDEMSIWHPLWFPKMVLDEAERKAKDTLKSNTEGQHHGAGVSPWEQDDQWGNDGLVTVQSARWGEFLGILEGCDHWDIRGWRGSFMEFNVDLPSVSIPLGGLANRIGGEVWPLGDWGRFIGGWRKQEKGLMGGLQVSAVMSQSTRTTAMPAPRNAQADRNKRKQGDLEDPVVKASTDQLSAVFDWIIEQVPPS
ncbi:hypothetical protein ID866_1427, partial [Astraeus odoratus]